MPNQMQRNLDSLRSALKAQQANNILFGSADLRIDAVLAHLEGEYDMPSWPRPMRLAMLVNDSDWATYMIGPMSMALAYIAQGAKPSREILCSIRNRMTRCSKVIDVVT